MKEERSIDEEEGGKGGEMTNLSIQVEKSKGLNLTTLVVKLCFTVTVVLVNDSPR